MESVFKKLNQINVSDKVEKKNTYSYLSWTWAWSEVKKIYPSVQRKVYEREDGRNYFDDGKTAWVKVGVIIDEIEHIDYLPVMSFNNKSIRIEDLTSMDVNKAIQRSTVKALALHGLGLYIYAGEDMPSESEEVFRVDTSVKKQSNMKVKKGKTLIELNIGDENWKKVYSYVVSNKHMGSEELLKTLSSKYEITNVIKEKVEEVVAS